MSRIRQLKFGGEQSSLARCRIGLDSAYATSNCFLDHGIIECRKGYTLFGSRTSAHSGDICWGVGYGKYTGNEVQKLYISGGPTGGTFTLTFGGQTTATITYNATSSAVKAALEALSNINIGDIAVTGNNLPEGPISISFGGQYANTDVSLITANSSSLTGGTTPTVQISEVVKGGSFEEIIVAIQKNGESDVTMYSVSPITGVYTEIVDGLDASDWYFEQYGQKIYALNGVDGLHYKVLGGSWNNGVSTEPPIAPSRSPQPYQGQWLATGGTEYGVSSIGNYSGFGTSPTATIIGSESVEIKFAASITTPTLCTFEMTLAGNDALQLRDVHLLAYSFPKGQTGTVISGADNNLEFINADGSPVTITPRYGQVSTTDSTFKYFQFVGDQRASRDNVNKIKVSMYVNKASKNNTVTVSVRHYNSWPLSYDPPDMEPFKKATGKIKGGTIQYAYCYYRVSDAAYSALSPEMTVTIPDRSFEGYYLKGTVDVSSELSGSDKIMVYRREKDTGKWRLIQNTDISTYGYANTGSVTFTDAWMEHELASFPEYPSSIISSWPTSSLKSQSAVGISSWKRALSIGTRYLLLVSAINRPETFIPPPDDYNALASVDIDDSTMGVTEYAAGNRAEEIVGLAGQDALYIVTLDSVYAKIGDTPLSSTPPRRLPTSTGAVGTRSTCRFKDGVLVASKNGLWRYTVARGFTGIDDGSEIEEEATKSNRDNWASFLGSSYSGVSVCEYEDEIRCANGTKVYFVSKNREHSRYNYTDSVKTFLPVRGRGLYFADSNGRLMLISTSTTDNGTAIEWSYSSGDEDFPVWTKIRNVYISGEGNPTITIHVWDSGKGYRTFTGRKEDNKRWVIPINTDAAYRMRIEFSGKAEDYIETVFIEMDGVPGGKLG